MPKHNEDFPDIGSNDMEIIPKHCEYLPGWLSAAEADKAFKALLEEVDWKCPKIRMFGKWIDQPRLLDWQGDKPLEYRYSGQTLVAQPWHRAADAIRRRLEHTTGMHFNTVLLNYYRDGRDSMGWHSDDEPELGKDPVIASVSLGAARDFAVRGRTQTDEKYKLKLEHGSLLWMKAGFQQLYQHALPKRAQAAPRINLTFRYII